MSFDPRQVNVVLADELMESCDQMVSHILIRGFPFVLTKLSDQCFAVCKCFNVERIFSESNKASKQFNCLRLI